MVQRPALRGGVRPGWRWSARARRRTRPDLRHVADARPERLRRIPLAGRASSRDRDGRADRGRGDGRVAARNLERAQPRSRRSSGPGTATATTRAEGRRATRSWPTSSPASGGPMRRAWARSRPPRTSTRPSGPSSSATSRFGDGWMGAVNGVRPDGAWTYPASSRRRYGPGQRGRWPPSCWAGASRPRHGRRPRASSASWSAVATGSGRPRPTTWMATSAPRCTCGRWRSGPSSMRCASNRA